MEIINYIKKIVIITIIFVIFVIFGILGFIIGIYLNQNVFDKYDKSKYNKKNKLLIWLDIALELGMFGIIIFVGRSLFSKFLLPTIYNYINKPDFNEQRDIKSTFAFIFALTLLYVQYNMKLKLDYLAGIQNINL